LTDQTALEVRGVTKRFGGQTALRDVSLAIRSGSVHAIAGENGAGKSTLIKILAGVHEPDEGEVLVRGVAQRIANPRVAQELRLGFLHQRLNLVPSLSVRENLLLTTAYPTAGGVKIDWREVDSRCSQALATAGIDVAPTLPVRDLNPAQQQLVALARVLMERPDVLVLDEPTATLGASDTAHLLDVIRAQQNAGATVIFVSHRLDEILELADTVTVLRDGRLVETTVRSALTRAALVQLLGGATQEAEQLEAAPQAAGAVPRKRQHTLLELDGVESPDLDNPVSVSIDAGEVVGLAGLVGTGRSTLATILAGGGTVSAGSIRVDGSEVSLRNRRAAIAHGIVLVPPDRGEGIVPDFDVRQNLTLGHVSQYTWKGLVINRRAERRATAGYVEQLAIRGAKGGAAARNLSGGNQQKVLIARALDRSPRVLVLDEPTAGIDLGTKEYIYGLVRSLAADGLGILFISSELEELPLVADRTLVFSRGLVTHELPGSASRNEIVHRLFEVAPVAAA
jgi:ABC-type sugar transport system ATPase subunit